MMKVVENPQAGQYSDFVHTVHRRFDKEGTVLFKRRNEIRLFEVNGLCVNVKKFRTPRLFSRIVYTFFRLPKAQRSFQYALKLREKGIETPEPIAYILTSRSGLLYESYYISRHAADYDRNMYEFGKGGIEGREHILDAFAGFTANFHENGVYHKDYSPGNILFKEESSEAKFCVVDLNRMRFGHVSVMQGCANFARLWGQKPLFDRVVRKYTEKRGADPKQCIWRALLAREKYWKRFARKRPIPFEWDK
jgi:serine/threonine protein kinase